MKKSHKKFITEVAIVSLGILVGAQVALPMIETSATGASVSASSFEANSMNEMKRLFLQSGSTLQPSEEVIQRMRNEKKEQNQRPEMNHGQQIKELTMQIQKLRMLLQQCISGGSVYTSMLRDGSGSKRNTLQRFFESLPGKMKWEGSN